MKPDVHDDPLLQMLSTLPVAVPDGGRSARALSLCHEEIRRRQRPSFAFRVVEPALVGGFALVYLMALMLDLLHWRGLI